MPYKEAQYDLVSDDNYSSRCNYSEEDFQVGLKFPAKMVGKMDVPQPSHRNEIVAAMRRIRYDFKSQANKKQRVFICISVDGITITYRRRKVKLKWWKEVQTVIYQHPIHRVFYVSHDSQDLKIFSYIARDTITNLFMCIVFKSYHEKDAIEIVSAIGQAFEICHKLHMDSDKDNVDSTVSVSVADTIDTTSHDQTVANNRNTSVESKRSKEVVKNVPSVDQEIVSEFSTLVSSNVTSGMENVLQMTVSSESSTITKSIKKENEVIKSTPKKSSINSQRDSFKYPLLPQLIALIQDQIRQMQAMKNDLANLSNQIKNEKLSRQLLEKLHEQQLFQNENLIYHISQITKRLNSIENYLAMPVAKSKSLNILQNDSKLTSELSNDEPLPDLKSDGIARSATYCYQNESGLSNYSNNHLLSSTTNNMSVDYVAGDYNITANTSAKILALSSTLNGEKAPSVPPRLRMPLNVSSLSEMSPQTNISIGNGFNQLVSSVSPINKVRQSRNKQLLKLQRKKREIVAQKQFESSTSEEYNEDFNNNPREISVSIDFNDEFSLE